MTQDQPIEPAGPPDLEELLRTYEPMVANLVRAEAGVTLLRFDSAEDLAQGAMQEAIRAIARFRWEGDAAFRSWLCTIARRHLSARRDYWFAGKRRRGALLRLTLTGIPGQQSGPSTFAFRREQLLLASKAMAMLLPRDQDLAAWSAQDVSTAEMGERLGISEDAAEKARARALERLRKTYFLLARVAGHAS